jgi:hypothetical protein
VAVWGGAPAVGAVVGRARAPAGVEGAGRGGGVSHNPAPRGSCFENG